MNNQQMTWEEIKNKYPHQYVGLIDVKYGINNATIDSAVVKYTSSDLSYNELINLYLQGEILLRYTTLDEDEVEGLYCNR